ncbi:alpha/beta fold hydrolase [Phenylobacterium sp.]|uniref:alpha/beta fold hydrolase n=1 Tax=Phenylobacterium sp. TaxID=1871053 RepID=UPI0027341B87|nr:alpha/beta hydrolase [Phenylobacterium sp.]MDP3659771.1 alpha/beta hydrolase [Phenylobacterium sp.]
MSDAPKSADEQSGENYDDRPVRAEAELPPEVQAPLAIFAGAEPPSPQWFKDAVAQAPERIFVESLGSKIELLTWGEIGKPGLLLAHGNSAHAGWWSFIAPFLANDYRVAAMSLAGMGQSDWRDQYRFDDFAADAEACARAAGLYESGEKPIYVGHSFGGILISHTTVTHPELMRAAVLVDTVFGRRRPPKPGAEAEGPRILPSADRVNRVYPTMAAALARFRLMPPQVAGEIFTADFIARGSLKEAPLPDGSGTGWTWRFDPQMWNKMDPGALRRVRSGEKLAVGVPMAHLYGAESTLLANSLTHGASPLPDDIIKIAIPAANHHVMIDQPLALVAALRALLAVWPA